MFFFVYDFLGLVRSLFYEWDEVNGVGRGKVKDDVVCRIVIKGMDWMRQMRIRTTVGLK